MSARTSVNKRQRELQRKERQAEKHTRRDERRVKRNGGEMEPVPAAPPPEVPPEVTEGNQPAAEPKPAE